MANAVEKTADAVRGLGAKAAYGEPVEIGGETIIPVSLVWFGFGAGQEAGGDDGPVGGGGGGAAIPIGAYTPGLDGPAFKPNLIALLAVSIPLACVVGNMLPKIIRALKK
jgi:hypothetical protein